MPCKQHGQFETAAGMQHDLNAVADQLAQLRGQSFHCENFERLQPCGLLQHHQYRHDDRGKHHHHRLRLRICPQADGDQQQHADEVGELIRKICRQTFRIGNAMVLEEHTADRFAHLAGQDGQTEPRNVNTQTFRCINMMTEQRKKFLPAHEAQSVVD